MLIASKTISLDGYVAGPDISEELPMGANGDQLHRWIFDPTPVDREVLTATFATIGAVVLGRRTFDIGLDQWDADTPYPVPSFVVTHRPQPELVTKSASFVFLPTLIEAVDRAKAAADDKDVILMGAHVTQQALAAGLVDELRLQLAPLVLGAGTRLFTGTELQTFEFMDANATPNVVHLRFRTPTRHATERRCG